MNDFFSSNGFKAQAENTHHPEFNTYMKNKDGAHIFQKWSQSLTEPSKEIGKCSVETVLQILTESRDLQWPVLGQMDPDDLMRTMISTAHHIERARRHVKELDPEQFCDILTKNALTQAAVAIELLRFMVEDNAPGRAEVTHG